MPGSIRAYACNERRPPSVRAEEMARPRPHAGGAARRARRALARHARSAPHRFRAEPQAAGRPRPRARDRPARPRSSRPRPARRAARAVHRRLHGRPDGAGGRGTRARRRIRRALALDRAHAYRRRPALVSVHPAGDDDQRHRRARPSQHHPEPFGRRMGRVCSRRARRGALGQAARLRPRGGSARHEPDAALAAPRPAQRRAVHRGGRQPSVLVVHRGRGSDQLPRLRYPAADARVGQHALGEPRLPVLRLVAGAVPGRCASADGARRQPARRLAPRRHGPEAPGLSGSTPAMAKSHFFAYLSRMKFIRRWGLMHSTYPENIQEHSLRVAQIAHALAIIRNRLFGGDVSPERAATLALYHDTSEVLTGDLPAPVKEFNPEIHRAYHAIEAASKEKLFGLIPDPLKPGYEAFFRPDPRDETHRLLVRAADKICAYLKCLEETGAGNPEFAQAEKALRASVEGLDLPEVRYFMETFVPSFRLTLDELH